jgi:hypothetical protein
MRSLPFAGAIVLFALVACSDSDPGTGGASTGASTADGGSGDEGGGASNGGSPSIGGAGAGVSNGGATSEGGSGGQSSGEDLDGDGIPQDVEDSIAFAYRPFLSVHPSDSCPLGGIVYRVHPHPDNPALVHVVYDHLFENDCGLNGHVGDDEVFGITVDPNVPPPAGIVSVVAISHQNTACEHVSTCGSCGDMNTCNTGQINGEAFPAIYFSQDKHGSYVNSCSAVNCFDTCSLAPTSEDPPMVNAGEPEAKLIDNLTTQGFITAENGWTAEELFDFDPWDTATDFGSAGNVAGDLVDPAFVPCAG